LTGGIEGIDNIENSIVSAHVVDNNGPGIRSRRWLRRLGCRWQDMRKGVFIDGHERPDVIE
jgi:hypothetical protein